jgi:hypothetical protein
MDLGRREAERWVENKSQQRGTTVALRHETRWGPKGAGRQSRLGDAPGGSQNCLAPYILGAAVMLSTWIASSFRVPSTFTCIPTLDSLTAS